MAPPAMAAELFDSVQPLTVRLGPLLAMAPPRPPEAELLVSMQLLTVSADQFSMAPPPRPSGATPFVIVRPLSVTLTPLDCVWPTWNTREVGLPLIVRVPAPGPAMVRLCVMTNSPLVRVMVPFRPGGNMGR